MHMLTRFMLVMMMPVEVFIIVVMFALFTMAGSHVVFVLMTDTVLLLAAAVVDGVEQVLLDEECEGAEDRASVNSRKDTFQVGQSKCKIKSSNLFPD